MKPFLCQFLRDDRGATAVEYGLIAALIAVAIIATRMTAIESGDSKIERTFRVRRGILS